MSSALHKQFATDPELEKNGVLVEYPDPDGGKSSFFRIARAGGANMAYSKTMERLAKPLRRQIANEQLSPAQAQRITKTAFVETVLLGWENVTDPTTDELVNFSVPAALKLFEELPDLYADLAEQAGKAALFRKAALEADAKN